MTELITKNIINAFTGTTPVKAIYRGTNKIWESGSGPVPPEPTDIPYFYIQHNSEAEPDVTSMSVSVKAGEKDLTEYSLDGVNFTNLWDEIEIKGEGDPISSVGDTIQNWRAQYRNRFVAFRASASGTNTTTNLSDITSIELVDEDGLCVSSGEVFKNTQYCYYGIMLPKDVGEYSSFTINLMVNSTVNATLKITGTGFEKYKQNNETVSIQALSITRAAVNASPATSTAINSINVTITYTPQSITEYGKTISGNNKLYFRRSSAPTSNIFKPSGKYNVGGNIHSIVNYHELDTSETKTANSSLFKNYFDGDYRLVSVKELVFPYKTVTNNCYEYMFNNCVSLTDSPILSATTLAEYCYHYMFNNCTALTSAPELPATTLADSCYSYMFNNCTALTSAPSLPATTLASSCYEKMFYGCSALTEVPYELPATTMVDRCYYSMFDSCSSLTQAPSLPATTLADSCYYQMFYRCKGLTSAPSLPATTLASSCYESMFNNSGLTSAPELPATTLASSCYDSMFWNTNITQAPSLPATTLADSCYKQMFYACKSLTQAPDLPAMTLANNCYRGMFISCSSLTQAPSELPATTLADSCYYEMFRQSGISSSPILRAETLVPNCYYCMFHTCNNLNVVKTYQTVAPSTSYSSNWLVNTKSTGSFFTKQIGSEWRTTVARGYSTVPSGWTMYPNLV